MTRLREDAAAGAAQLVPYDQARTALAEAKTFDDVKEIMNRAEAMAVYYRRANDKTLEADAIEIRMFAQRRYGQMLTAQKAQGLLSRGTAGKGRPKLGGSDDEPPKGDSAATPPLPTLKDLGISKQFSSRAQKLAAMLPAVFEAKVAAWREETLTSDRVSTNLLDVGREEEQREHRRTVAQALSDTSHELTGARSFPCVYLDPAYARKAGIGDRAYENHYRTEKWDGILDIMQKVAPALQPNAWAFIWIPRAHMLALHPVKYRIVTDDGAIHEVEIKTPLIWAIARALGCSEYSTCFVWTKTDEEHPDEHGTFLIARDQDEMLCLYKKGDGLPRPAPEHIYGSNHRERSRPLGHSVKPPFYRRMIADMVGIDAAGRPLPVLELFARFDAEHPLPENWQAWGNESEESLAKATEGKAGTAEVSDLVRRSTAGTGLQVGAADADRPATSEFMDVTAGETAPNSVPQATPACALEASVAGSNARCVSGVTAGETAPNSEIPQEASGTTRKVPGGPLSGGPSVVAAYSQVPIGGSDAAGEAEPSSRLHSLIDPDALRWESEGGRILPDDDCVIVRSARAGRLGA